MVGFQARESMGQTVAQKNRAVRQESLRELLQAQGHLQHVIELLDHLADLDKKLDAQEIQRIKTVIDAKLKLIGKYLPDLKAMELTGDEGGPLQVERVMRLVQPSG